MKQTDKRTWKIIRDKVLSFLKWMKSQFEGYTPETAQGQFFHELKGEIDELYDAFYNTLASASDTMQWAGSITEANIKKSTRKKFSAEIDEWNKDGQPEGDSFILGTTGDVLQGLGAIESDIFMNGDKISKILEDHPEITLDEIKKNPPPTGQPHPYS